ncbi:MAG: hypothetical protein BWY63_00926 [Chloroflexi bacterium ADurb.Bin360]|nr:MAG: hypothetical protein BWY63_00926 [Chloroflexi bacterium ADurb.Bin360]
MKKLLFISVKYSGRDRDPYLTDDLVHEMHKQGHQITVIAYGDKHISRARDGLTEYVLRVPPSPKILKYFALWPALFLRVSSTLVAHAAYDQIIVTAPLSVLWPAALAVRFARSLQKTVVIFDIYPAHQVRIGALPRRAESLLKWLEIFLLRGFTEVTAMGQNNEQYIRDYYFRGTGNMPIKIISLWARMNRFASSVCYSGGPVKIVFGGQIIKGRSIDRLVEFLGKVRQKGSDIELTFFSWGPHYEELIHKYSQLHWIYFNSRVDREEYWKLLPDYHVGAIVTDETVNLPAFPSKIVDYLSAGLYCFCLVEPASELYTTLGGYRRVYINSFDFSDSGLQSASDFFHSIGNNCNDPELLALERVFSVSTAVARVLG